jgi:hypothetical protein
MGPGAEQRLHVDAVVDGMMGSWSGRGHGCSVSSLVSVAHPTQVSKEE